MDDAGQMAADRGIKECLAHEINLKIIVLPFGKDPDDSLKNNPNDFRLAVEGAKSMLEYYLDKISAGLNLEELDNKQIVAKKMLAMLALVNNKLEQDFWLQRLSDRLSTQEALLRESLLKIREATGVVNKEAKSAAKGEILEATSREEKLSELLFALLLRFPEYFTYGINNIEPDYFAKDSLIKFYNNLIIYYNKVASLDYDNLRLYLEETDPGAEKLLDKLILLGEKDFYNYETAAVKAEIINIISELKKYGRQKLINKLQQEIALAEKRGDQTEIDRLMNSLRNLTTV